MLSGCCIITVEFYHVFCVRMHWLKIKLNSLKGLQSTVSDILHYWLHPAILLQVRDNTSILFYVTKIKIYLRFCF